MIGFVITGHGPFASGIMESVQFIAGKVEQISVVPFQEDQEKLYKDLKQAISEVDTGSGTVCFADLAGGTPFNVCSRIALTRKNVRVIGGTNSPMLLSGLFQRELELDQFVDLVLSEGKESIKTFQIKDREKKE
ncbi:PTS sugar transporter subunit IIA [Thermoactinomyces sp. AMNI-1]|uniref:PTS sugar transporter subunit IIA n=1 Tax=Thermoactinomyces mirandus TaxID=2756294 RepID=A0A7W1XU39_9BACL|nr:PTS sugar transporter subunit IIA [Thermoactinomyces mirandus]